MKDGRFGNWLSGARDWSVFAQPILGALPVWKAEDGGTIVIGSIKKSGRTHRARPLTICTSMWWTRSRSKRRKVYHRIPGCWIVGLSRTPRRLRRCTTRLKNTRAFEEGAAGRLHRRGTRSDARVVLFAPRTVHDSFDKPAFEHVIVNGLVMAEDGVRRCQAPPRTIPIPWRWWIARRRRAAFYLMSSPVTHAENLRFRPRRG